MRTWLFSRTCWSSADFAERELRPILRGRALARPRENLLSSARRSAMHARTPVSTTSIAPGSIIAWRLLAPATVGAATGACVAAASAIVEDWALGQLAALPGAIPALFSPLALLITWLVARHVTRAERPATSELYILAYHQPEPRIPLRELPGRLLGAATTVALGGPQGFEPAAALIGVARSALLARWAPPAESPFPHCRRRQRRHRRRLLLAGGRSALWHRGPVQA